MTPRVVSTADNATMPTRLAELVDEMEGRLIDVRAIARESSAPRPGGLTFRGE